MKSTIDRVLLDLRVPSKYTGFRQLSRAVELSIQNEDCLLNINRNIYKVIAAEFNVEAKSIEKNIRTLLDAAWKRGCRERYETITGYTYEVRPTVGEFLDTVSAYCQKEFQLNKSKIKETTI